VSGFAAVPVEDRHLGTVLGRPVAALAVHAQLAAFAWAFAQAAPGARLGYIQTAGGTLRPGDSRSVSVLRDRGMLAGELAIGEASAEQRDVISTVGALDNGLTALGWDAAVCGPGPGAVGFSGTPLGHIGLSALDAAHAALALGCPALLVPLMSDAGQGRSRRGISRHTLTVLDLLLAPVTVALPAGVRSPVGAELRAGLGAVFGGASRQRPAPELQVERPARITRHDWRRAAIDLPGYAASMLARATPERDLLGEPLFFAAALAAGVVLAQLARPADGRAVAGPRREHESGAGAQRGEAKLGA
jgi:Protein of unknown function (DUF3866)